MAETSRSRRQNKSSDIDRHESGPILPIPRIPEGLIEAAQLGTLVPFIGAGLSRLAGCPGWPELAAGALRQLAGRGGLTHAHIAQIAHLNPRVKLSIARIISREKEVPLDFRSLLHPTNWSENSKGRRVYGLLSKLSTRFITTNYDEWLLRDWGAGPTQLVSSSNATAIPPITRTALFRARDLTPAALVNGNCVLHLHGSLEAEDEMILTTQDYIAHYASDRGSGPENYVLTFLDHLFSTKTVLFIGYGLEELEILEYVILKAKQYKRGASRPEHFLLQGFFSYERDFMLSMKSYYRDECGIQLIPFVKDLMDWDQLIEVIEHLTQVAPAADPLLLEDFTEMERLVNE